MYIRREKSRGSSLLRVALLSALIVAGTLFIQQMFQGARWARPFDPTPTPTLTAAYHITQGDIYFAEGQLQQAIDSYERAIAMEPDNDVPYEKEALLLVYTGDTARALTQAEQAVLLNPARSENLARYCQTLDWEGHYSQAFDACECAIELAPDYAPAYAYLAEVYADQADWIPASRTAQQAIEVDFQSPDAHHNMGYALEVQGRYDEAVEFYENAITLRPNLAPYYLSAGQTYYWLGRFEEAADRFGKAIKLNPTDPVGYDQIGWTYHAEGESIRAIDALQQALSVDAVYYRAWGRLATIYYLRQNYEEAIKNFPIAIDLAEKRFLQQARDIQIFTEIEGATEPESVPILQGRFEKDVESDNLTAVILPVEWTHQPASAVGLETCGHLIAQTLQNQLIRVSPSQDVNFTQAFSQTRGSATLDITSGELYLDMENLPPPQNIPYEVRVRYRPDEVETLGFVQPDAGRSVETRFSFDGRSDAPTSYYYGLALSFVYLEPPRCEEAIPWLLKAVEKDPAYYNPAWEGFKTCPTEDAPPTPLPTPTPLPEEIGAP
jgi:tetratricopeptide (TPR) repeat protein